MIVIGAGIGGLLCASLSKNVKIFEKSEIGGRFRNFTKKGFQLTTGAVHMIPHGSRGPIAKILKDIGAKVRIVNSSPPGTFLLDKEYDYYELLKKLNLKDKVKVPKMLYEMRSGKAPDISIKEYFERKTQTDFLIPTLRSFTGWSLSMDPGEVKAQEFFEIVKNIQRFRGPGVPIKGCSGVIDALVKVCLEKDSEIIKSEVKEILTEDYKVLGVLTDDSVEHYDDVVISDIGVRETSKLCKFPKYYLKEIKKVKPSEGIKISVAVEERLIRHTGILFTPNCERIDGLNQVTNVDPTLAPKEKHLVLTHQFLHSNNLRKEAELGLSDFERLFGDRKYEILTISSHRAKNPVNRAASGYDLDQRTPIKGLYLVGDCAKVSGGMDVDGIALGVRKVYNYIKEDFNQKS